VVEDDDNLRFALREGLAAAGFTVRTAADADEAYREAAAVPPDVVLLDWILPGGHSGIAVCRGLQSAHPGTRIVMLTGLSDVRDQRIALEAGASAFLRKGLPLDELAAELRRVL
jgi:two-component system, OmpR family, response regulator MprA